MANHNRIGQYGEELALNFLLEKNYNLLEKNWRWGRAEIDLIVSQNEILVFVEVKTRNNNKFGLPETQVTNRKQQLILDAAGMYCYKTQHSTEIRFDIIAITLQPCIHIVHFEDAFFPTW